MKLSREHLPGLFVLVAAVLGVFARAYGAWHAGEIADIAQSHGYADALVKGISPYREHRCNYLPGLFPILYGAKLVSLQSGIAFWKLLRGVVLFFDVLTLAALYFHVRTTADTARARWVAIAYALNPIVIIIIGNHGQYDGIASFFALLAAMALTARKPAWLIGALVGVGTTIKPQIVLILPLLAWGAGLRPKDIVVIALVCGAIMLGAIAPFLLTDPLGTITPIVSYQGLTDQGWGGLLRGLWLVRADNYYLPGDFGNYVCRLARWVFLALLVFIVHTTRGLALTERIALVYLTFLAIFPGISTQYLYWPVVWLLCSRAPVALAQWYGAGVSLGALGFYTFFFPPMILTTSEPPYGPGWYYALGQIVSYTAIVAALVSAWRRFGPSLNLRSPAVAVPLIVAALLSAPIMKELSWYFVEWKKVGRFTYEDQTVIPRARPEAGK